MKHREPVSHIMSTDLITANVTTPFSEVKTQMINECMNHMPVVADNKLLGILSMTDILKNSHSAALVGEQQDHSLDHTVKIEDIMTKEPTTIKAADTVAHAAEMLETSPFNSLPVVNDADELVGIVTTKDLISYLLKQY